MGNKILLTIGMPVFNDKDFIEESLNSILKQSFQDFILIISDDGSTDGSGEICKRFTEKDKRISYIRQEKNLGISKNMQYLLSLANTKYFMWAGDDDLYDEHFISKLISVLKKDDKLVSAFCTCQLIDEKNNPVSEPLNFDYQNSFRTKRLKNYISHCSDYFGYGIFQTEIIKDVQFPIWWWPNRKTPYNNIFPTLCYYLTIGDFYLLKGNPLFFKRIKSGTNVHHKIIGDRNAIKESLAFWIRRFNLVCFSAKQIYRASNFFISLSVSPHLYFYWFIIPSWEQLLLAAKSFFRNRLKLSKKT